jgi:DNA-binding transcriptional LysR family regulator
VKDLDLTTLRYFIAVCETGSITRAAEQEHLVTSAVSKRLAQLEEDLGVQVLQRQRRGVAPSPTGELLLEHARTMLANATRVVQDMASFGSGIRGKVRLLATVSSIAEALPDDVASFMKMPEHREIQVDIEENLSRDIIRRVKEGSASLGVLWDASDMQGLKMVPYRIDNLAVVTHPGHPLASRAKCLFEETLDFDHVGLQASSAVNSMLLRAAAVAGKPISYRTQVSNFEASLRVVRANLGIAIIPKEIADFYVKQMDLRLIRLTNPWAKRRFLICYRDRSSLPKAAALLLDYLGVAASNKVVERKNRGSSRR